ncbi:MAG: YraN family protein [Pseudomonadota bacterium]
MSLTSIGAYYEDEAAKWLCRRGMVLLAKNYRSRLGEIDIIAMDGKVLVFIEVRARSHSGYSSAAGSIDHHKRQRVVRTAQTYLQQHPEAAKLACRFDVIAFEPRQSASNLTLRWIPGAFTA